MKQSDIKKYLIYIENNKYFYYLLPFDIISYYVKNWSKNRIQDEQKVNEMYETYIEKKHLHFFLHLAFDKEEKMVCYDGNHRLRVLERLLTIDKINLNIFISVMWDSNYKDIFEDFENLNKQNTISEIYITQAKYSDSFIKNIEQFVHHYTNKYKQFVKTSNCPKAPHFSIDLFKTEILNIYEKLPKDKKDLNLLQDIFNKYENHIKNNVAIANNKRYEKCNKYNFWLFYKKPLDIDIILSYC